MNRFLTVLLGLMATGAGCLLGGLATLSIVGIADQALPLTPLVLAFTVSIAMLCLGLITLMSYAYETRFDKNGIEMQFVFRKDRVPWELVEWHRNVGFRNRISGGANVWTVLKYKRTNKPGEHSCIAVLLVTETTGPAVGMAIKEFKTPLDSFLSHKHL